MLATWRVAIEAARQEREAHGEQPQTYGEEAYGDEADHVYRAFQGTLEEADLISFEWIHPYVALAQFDSDPEQREFSCFGGCDAGLVGIQEAFLIGPNDALPLGGTTRDWESDCRNWGEDKVTLFGESEGNGGLIYGESETGGETLDAAFSVIGGTLEIFGEGCEAIEREQSASGESLVCYRSPAEDAATDTSRSPHASSGAVARTTLALLGPNASERCLSSLHQVERAAETVAASRREAPHRYIEARLADTSFQAGRQCAAPPRAARLRARNALRSLQVNHQLSGVIQYDESAWLEGDEVQPDIPTGAFAAWWSRVRFSCASDDGFAMWLRAPDDSTDKLYWASEDGVAPLFAEELSELAVTDQSYEIRRVALGSSHWSWFITASLSTLSDRDGVCEPEESCFAMLISGEGERTRLSCDAQIFRSESGVSMLWDPGAEDFPETFLAWPAEDADDAIAADIDAFRQLLEERELAASFLDETYALLEQPLEDEQDRAEVLGPIVAILTMAGVPNAQEVVAGLRASSDEASESN